MQSLTVVMDAGRGYLHVRVRVEAREGQALGVPVPKEAFLVDMEQGRAGWTCAGYLTYAEWRATWDAKPPTTPTLKGAGLYDTSGPPLPLTIMDSNGRPHQL